MLVIVKWNPDVAEPLFLRQSATLYAFYYTIQICIHRGFIPFPGKPSPLSFPSMAICTNAARSCIHILDAQYVRLGAALLNGLHQVCSRQFDRPYIFLPSVDGSF